MARKNYINSGRVWANYRKRVLDRDDDGSGSYICGICDKSVGREEASIDHIKPMAAYPHLARDLSNMRVVHIECNNQKSREDKLRKKHRHRNYIKGLDVLRETTQ